MTTMIESPKLIAISMRSSNIYWVMDNHVRFDIEVVVDIAQYSFTYEKNGYKFYKSI